MELKDIIGKTLVDVKREYDRLLFYADTGEEWIMYHSQDCCECVCIEDINGDLSDLIGSPIIKANEMESNQHPVDKQDYNAESFTWTFYHFATIKGYVTIRWYGESNGYYSESVTFTRNN